MRAVIVFVLLSVFISPAFSDDVIYQEPFDDPNGHAVFVVSERPTTHVPTLQNLLENDSSTLTGLCNAEYEE